MEDLLSHVRSVAVTNNDDSVILNVGGVKVSSIVQKICIL
jgi:hypothetical protein